MLRRLHAVVSQAWHNSPRSSTRSDGYVGQRREFVGDGGDGRTHNLAMREDIVTSTPV